MEFMHTTLDNGLVIVGERNEAALSMACVYYVKAGSRDETPDESGVSHFLEHMMFKGSDRRSYEDINREFKEIGADHNAITAWDDTFYYGGTLPEYQPRLIDLLTDMMRPALRRGDYDMEKKVILEEIAMNKDEPLSFSYMMSREIFANGHPSGNNILGTTESISALERDQMKRYFERQYSPSNMLVALTGAFDWDAAVRQIEKLTRGWKRFEVDRDAPSLNPAAGATVVQDDRMTQEYLRWYWPGLNCQDERRRAADVLACALGGDVADSENAWNWFDPFPLGDDVGSRLYRGLTAPGLAESAWLEHLAEDRFGYFSACVVCDPERAGEVVRKVQDILREAVQDGISIEEIERAKQKIASALILRSEKPLGRLLPVAMAWEYRGEYLNADEAADRILSVTKEDIDALLADDPFANGTLVALGPLETLET